MLSWNRADLSYLGHSLGSIDFIRGTFFILTSPISQVPRLQNGEDNRKTSAKENNGYVTVEMVSGHRAHQHENRLLGDMTLLDFFLHDEFPGFFLVRIISTFCSGFNNSTRRALGLVRFN